jgi:hypothetical protein
MRADFNVLFVNILEQSRLCELSCVYFLLFNVFIYLFFAIDHDSKMFSLLIE